jgi:hypothetical protein
VSDDYLHNMPPKNRLGKSRCSNLQKGKEVVSVIVFRGVLHSIQRTQRAINCQKFLDDPILLSLPDVVESDASPDGFPHFMEILKCSEPQFYPQIANNVML